MHGKLPTARLFSGMQNKRGAEMLKVDLEVACIEYQDASGHFADFHSLRHTFVTNLCRADVSPKTAQSAKYDSIYIQTVAKASNRLESAISLRHRY